MRKTLAVSAVILMAALLAACSKQDKPDPFAQHWQRQSEDHQGYSPSVSDLHPEPRVVMRRHVPVGRQEARKALPTTPVTLKLHGVDAAVALRSLSAAAGINVMLSPGVAGTVSLNVTRAPWRDVFLGILSSNGLEYRWQGNILQVLTAEEKQKEISLLTLNNQYIEQSEQARLNGPSSLTVLSVRYSEAEALKESLTKLLGQDKRASVDVDKHTNSIVLQCPAADQDRYIALVESLDRPRAQVQLKAFIVETTKDKARELGMKWGGVMRSGSRFHAGGPGAAEFGTDPVKAGYGEAAGLAGLPYALDYSSAANATSTNGLSFMFGAIGGNLLETQLNMMESEGTLNILSSPSITTLDNKMAFTENGEKVPYVSTSRDNGNNVKFEDAVLRLEMTPNVIDARNLKLNVLVKKDEVDMSRAVEGNPFIVKKQTQTTLIMRSGETLVISGLTKEKGLNNDAGVPGLRNAPLGKYLFGSTNKTHHFEEVLIFITPVILPVRTAADYQPKSLEKSPQTIHY